MSAASATARSRTFSRDRRLLTGPSLLGQCRELIELYMRIVAQHLAIGAPWIRRCPLHHASRPQQLASGVSCFGERTMSGDEIGLRIPFRWLIRLSPQGS